MTTMTRSDARLSRTLACLGWLAALGPIVAAQDVFRSPHPAMEPPPEWVAVGDLDGDLDADVVAIGTLDELVVLESLGGGAFAAPVVTSAGVGASHPRLVDMDGDGVLDLFLVHGGGGISVIETRLGLGDGSFGASLYGATSNGPLETALVDLDEDGFLDAAVPCGDANRLSVLRNNGFGGFLPKTDHGVPTLPRAAAAGDLDQDGHADVVVACLAVDRMASFLGDGTGALSALPVVAVAGSPNDVELLDLDGDGQLDAVVGHLSSTFASVLWGLGDGQFEAPLSMPMGLDTTRVIRADVDEDGRDDLVVGHDSGAQVTVLRAGETRSLGPLVPLGTTTGVLDLAAGDVTGDGDVDLVSVDVQVFFGGNTLTLLEGDGMGDFSPAYAGSDGASDVAFGDLDGDGRDDMVVAAEFSHRLSVRPGVRAGVFGVPATILLDAAPASVGLGDMDGDGLRDIVVGVVGVTDGVRIHRGTGSLAFDAPTSLAVPGSVRDLAVVDMDLDGDLDVLGVNETNSTFFALANDGSASFAAPVLIATAAAPRFLVVRDLDGDGDLDAAVAATNANVVHTILGDGAGGFASALTFPTLTLPEGIDAGDLDEDGVLDVVTPSDTSVGMLAVLRGLGGGFLDAPVLLATGSQNTSGVVLRDFDRDGHLDIVALDQSQSAGVSAGQVVFFHGDGTLSPGVSGQTRVTSLPRRLRAHDVDGDGAVDVALAAFSDQAVVLRNQLGPWTNLGHALGGTLGLPRQWAEGSLQGGEPVRFTLTDGRPFATAAHVLGVSAISAPFKGGVLVPSPDLIVFGLPLDGEGSVEFSYAWPSGLSGVELAFQFWFTDPAGPFGWAASQGVSGLVP